MSKRIKSIFALANEFKEGDIPVGGTRDYAIKMEAKKEVSAMRLGEITKAVFVDDGISEAIERSLDRRLASEVSGMTIAAMKDILLGPRCAEWVESHGNGLSSEVIAAVVKIMTDDELSKVACSIFNSLPGSTSTGPVMIGSRGHFGSRIQPNSPGDDEDEILLSVLEGLAFGCGDVIIGLNPASDDVETIARTEKLLESIVERLKLPTRYCVLSDIVKQNTVRSMTKVDVGFQSLAGTSKSLTGMLGLDVDGLLDLSKSFNGLYFETGQGSEVTNSAAEGVDMVTLESRCYGLARYLRQQGSGKWMIVNDVAGFIGPEVFRTGQQLLRACLEDMVMAKLHGITMGLDVCSTFHMGIDPLELQALTEKIVNTAAPAYLMGVAGKADPMLGILTTSYREHPRLRKLSGKQVASAMQRRLVELKVIDADGTATGSPETTSMLYTRYVKAGGDTRTVETIMAEGRKKIDGLKEKGCDLGYGTSPDLSDPPLVAARLRSIHTHARSALYASLDTSVIRDCCEQHIHITTNSADRDDYIAHPVSGELINDRDSNTLRRFYVPHKKAPQIMFVISDGLNANAVNENLRDVLPELRWQLKNAGYPVGEIDVVIKNGRVRAGYHAAELVGPDILIHLIGERPGTGLNQLSVYMTYGKDKAGNTRWSPGMDHSLTNAICSIHQKGKTPKAAVDDIMKCTVRMLELKCSGVSSGMTVPKNLTRQ